MIRYFCVVLLCFLGFCLRPISTQAQQAAAAADSAWRRIALIGDASVAMPASAHKSPANTGSILIYVANYQNIIYTSVANQVDPAKLSFSDGELSDDQLDEVYAATIKSLIGTDSAARIVARKNFDLAGHRGLEVKLDMPGDPRLSRTKFARVLYVPHTVYLLTWRETAAHDTTDSPGSRARYFNSLRVKVQPIARVSKAQGTERVVEWLLAVGLLAGLFFFVRRVTRPAQ